MGGRGEGEGLLCLSSRLCRGGRGRARVVVAPEGLYQKGPEPRGAHKDEPGQELGSCRQELPRRGARGRVAKSPRGFR